MLPQMRKQYHIRNSEPGLLAWDVDRLLRLTSGQDPVDLPLERIRELDETWQLGRSVGKKSKDAWAEQMFMDHRCCGEPATLFGFQDTKFTSVGV